jgi:hypothetical protein
MMESWVRSLTIDRVCVGTRPVVLFHWRNAVELKIGAKSESASSRNDAMRETMITMVPYMTNLTDNAPLKEGTM